MSDIATETKERPIIFSGEMVRALLNGTKTQTRRVVKPQPDYSILKHGVDLEAHECPILGPTHMPCEWGLYGHPYYPSAVPCFGYNCPYGKPGDRLWVREEASYYGDDSGIREVRAYAADVESRKGMKWKPSIYMPRWASRITLEIAGVRVERVQEISVKQCVMEGIKFEKYWDTPYADFAVLWDSINAKRGYPWQSNPWVWVITFKRVEP